MSIVRLGLASMDLRRALGVQRVLAEAHQEHLLLMTVEADCEACDRFDQWLRRGEAFETTKRLRLVVVDVGVFEEELRHARIPTNVTPAFFVTDEDGAPQDGIDHREWGANEPAEAVRRILGAFVDGRYHRRKREWSPLAGSIHL